MEEKKQRLVRWINHHPGARQGELDRAVVMRTRMKTTGLGSNAEVKAKPFVGYKGESNPPCLKLDWWQGGGTSLTWVLGKRNGNCYIWLLTSQCVQVWREFGTLMRCALVPYQWRSCVQNEELTLESCDSEGLLFHLASGCLAPEEPDHRNLLGRHKSHRKWMFPFYSVPQAKFPWKLSEALWKLIFISLFSRSQSWGEITKVGWTFFFLLCSLSVVKFLVMEFQTRKRLN